MRALARLLPSRRRDEHGVVAVVVAIVTCFTLIPLAAFAVDIGVQRVTRRDAQAVADTVALDLGRRLDGRTYGVLQPLMQGYADASANRSGIVGGGQFTISVELGTLTTFNVNAPGSYFQAFTGSTPAATKPDAVRVTASGKADFNFIGGEGAVNRSAVGTATSDACMTMDSYAARLNTGASTLLGPVGKILGTSIDTSLLSSSGLLTADLEVLSFLNVLKAQLGLVTFDDVLAANVSSAQVVAAEVAALNAQGATAAAQVLQSQIGLHVPPGSQINVGQLVGLTQGGSSGLGATLNPLDLAAAAVQLANGTNPIHLTATGTNLTGLALDVRVGSRPTRVCIKNGTVTMGQTTLTATANINAPGTLTSAVGNLVGSLNTLLGGVVGLLGGLLGADTYDLPTVTLGQVSAQLSLAAASGKILGVNCTNGKATSMSIEEGSSLAPATVTIPIVVRETRRYGSILNRQSETVTSTLLVTITTSPSAPQTVTATLDTTEPGDYDKGKNGPSGNLSVGNTNVSTVLTSDGTFGNGRPLVGTMLNGLSSVVTALQNNLIGPLTTTVVTPLLNALTSAVQAQLGLTLAGSNYTPERTPGCTAPKLVG